MKHEAQIKKWITEDRNRMNALDHALSLNLNDWCLSAGFVRNLVWDKLYGSGADTPMNDIDLIYFDSKNCNKANEKSYELQLKKISCHPWSVKNQARMHVRNNDQPYSSTKDAMSYWPEIETAVGVRLTKNRNFEILAPFGVKSLFQGTITINSKRLKAQDFMARVEGKKWLQRWPKLSVNA